MISPLWWTAAHVNSDGEQDDTKQNNDSQTLTTSTLFANPGIASNPPNRVARVVEESYWAPKVKQVLHIARCHHMQSSNLVESTAVQRFDQQVGGLEGDSVQ